MSGSITLKLTPMMQQWSDCKKRAGSAILFFRMGDFYEAFYEDAEVMASQLDLSLTKRQEIPMAGVPVHTCDAYIDKLVGKGFTVAVAEQVEDPKEAKGIVKREITRFVSPGSVIYSSLLQDKANNYFSCISQVGSLFALASLDLSTGEFFVTEFPSLEQLQSELYKIDPKELLLGKKFASRHPSFLQEVQASLNLFVTLEEDWHFAPEESYHFLLTHFGTASLDGFGLKGMSVAYSAAGALLKHISDSLQLPIQHIEKISPYATHHYLSLDRTSQRNLELVLSSNSNGKGTCLLSIIDHTHTPMGGRLLRKWLLQPLTQPELIQARQEAVQEFVENELFLNSFRQTLKPIRDLERLMMRISTGYAFAKDLVQLKTSLQQIPKTIESLKHTTSSFLMQQKTQLSPLTELTTLLEKALVEDPPLRVGEGKTFKPGFNTQLDEYNALRSNASDWMHSYQAKIREETGIKTLKVGFNRMFGYYIEVSKGQADRMPDTFIRRQTLVNGERFISPELKEFEQKVFSAEEKINQLEQQLFYEIKETVSKYTSEVMRLANALAHLDCIASLAHAALLYGYCCPEIDTSFVIDIRQGRHPVIEAISGSFTPNDLFLDNERQQLILLTGPNMAGKSTYIRQAALIVILAQIGSFVPASYARIGVVDKIFTRIGAHDDLSRGQSTFMVEMTETANILHNATSRSLVILDEIGRGTSTYDGISIAWSVAEHLLQQSDKKSRTLFATHYFELTKLEELYPGAVNYSVAVQEEADRITFLHKIIQGSADRSYGILVAKLAGLPLSVIQRAKEILHHLEEEGKSPTLFSPPKRKVSKAPKVNKEQLSLFG
jgi:DNA mismatch repair protein MutS